MKRCPECGYRVNAEELRDCPLCGVRMRNDPSGQTVRIETHVHENEECLLPNPTEEAAARDRYKTIMEQQLRDAGVKPTQEQIDARKRYKTIMEQQLRRAGIKQQPAMPKQLKQLIGIAVVLIIYALLGSCSV